MPIGRLFFEIGGDTSRLNASLQEAIKNAEEAGVKITRAGQSFISKFDEALNPTRKLAEQINVLTAAGKSQADIWKVMSDEINRASDAAKKNGQAIDPLVKSIQDLNKASLAGKLSFESIGQAVGDFAKNPLEAAKGGVSGLLSLLGPTAVGVGAVAAGVVAAGVAVFEFAEDASKAAVQIQNLSYATGMSVEKVQALNRAGQEKGLGDLTGSIEKLNAQLGKGEGGPFTEAILKAGIVPKEGADAIYYLEELRKHYAEISDPAERAQKATADLGRRLMDLLPIVLNNKESFSGMVSELERSSVVMKGPQIEALQRLHEEIEKHERAWDSVKLKAKEYAGEATLAFMKGVEAAQKFLTEHAPDYNEGKEWTGSGGHKDWTGSYGVIPRETTNPSILADRAKDIAAADAIAAGTKANLIGLTIQLNELEKSFTEEKAKQKGLDFDADRVKSLAAQIANTKELIKEDGDLAKQREKGAKEAEENIKKLATLNHDIAKIQESIDTKGHAALVPSQSQIDSYLKTFDKEQLERVKTYNEVESRITKEIATNKLDELAAQRDIIANTVPMNEQEAEQLKLEKANIDYMINAEEVRVKYGQIRLELQTKLNKLAEDDPLRKSAEADLGKLGEKERQELEQAGKVFSNDVLKVHREEYQKMIAAVREGAGEIFDILTSSGKDKFQSLLDWFKGSFMSGLKKLFQNFFEEVLTGFQKGLGGIFSGMTPATSGPSRGVAGITGGITQTAMAATAGLPKFSQDGATILGTNARNITLPDGTIFHVPATSDSVYAGSSMSKGSIWTSLLESGGKGMDLGTFFGGGEGSFFGSDGEGGFLGSGTGGINGKGVGGALGGMMMGGGMAMFMDSMKRGPGVGSFFEGIGGGAMAGFAAGGPWGALIGAIGGLTAGLVSAFKGKNAYQAGSQEVARDFGGLNMSQDEYKEFLNSNNISESQAYPIRRNIQTSPEFLKQAYGLAEQQGKVSEFMDSLGKIGYGSGDAFKGAFDVGRLTGDWSQLNKVWSENQALGQGVSETIRNSLLIGDATLKPYEQLIVDLNDLKKATLESIPPVKTMYQTFLETGEITDELRNQVAKLGGDIGAFEKVSELVKVKNDFDEMVTVFETTGEILPGLRQQFIDFGGDLEALDDAAALPGLKTSLTFINSLQSGLQNLAPELDPIKALLSGQWNSNIAAALTGAGLDPTKFEGLSGMIGTEQNWSKIATPFTKLTPQLKEALLTYGGDEGKTAVENYGKGFNTITQGLLDTTKEAMDEAYQAAVQDALDYIGTAQQETSDKIMTLTTAVETQFTIVSGNITDAIGDAKTALVDEIEKLITAVAAGGDAVLNGGTGASDTGGGQTTGPLSYDDWKNWMMQQNPSLAAAGIQESDIANMYQQYLDSFPHASTGGLITVHDQEAVLDPEQTRNLLRGDQQQRPVVQLVNCTIYGFQDFVEQVRLAGLDLQRRRDPQWA
jgi:hypothetical protein